MRVLVLLSALAFFLSDCSSPFSPEEGLRDLAGKIYFNSSRTGDCEIYAMNPDGSGIRNLTNSRDTDDWLCTVSSNGKKIAFTRGTWRDFNSFEIWIMNSDGSNPLQVTYSYFTDEYPAWR